MVSVLAGMTWELGLRTPGTASLRGQPLMSRSIWALVGMAPDEVEQAFDGLDRLVAGEAAADEVDFFELVGREEQFLAAGAALEDIDGGIDVALGDLAVEHEFHVAGALELLEDECRRPWYWFRRGRWPMMVREPASRVLRAAAKRRRGTSRAPASMPPDMVRRRRSAHGVVEGAGEAGDGIEHHEDVLAGLDEALGALDGEAGRCGCGCVGSCVVANWP